MTSLNFLIGFGIGVYVGTYYNCKPFINKIKKTIENNLPTEKK